MRATRGYGRHIQTCKTHWSHCNVFEAPYTARFRLKYALRLSQDSGFYFIYLSIYLCIYFKLLQRKRCVLLSQFSSKTLESVGVHDFKTSTTLKENNYVSESASDLSKDTLYLCSKSMFVGMLLLCSTTSACKITYVPSSQEEEKSFAKKLAQLCQYTARGATRPEIRKTLFFFFF